MLTYNERMKQMEGKSGEELYRTGLEFFGQGEEWEATVWYEAAMKKDNMDAYFAMARIKDREYQIREDKTDLDKDEVIDLYEKALELGHKNAGIFLGHFYLFLLAELEESEEEYDSEEEESDDEESEDDSDDENYEDRAYDLVDKASYAYYCAAKNGNKEGYYYCARAYEMGYLDNPANMQSFADYMKGAEADCYGAYLGLREYAECYGWNYILPMKKEVVLAKIKELSPYPPEEE